MEKLLRMEYVVIVNLWARVLLPLNADSFSGYYYFTYLFMPVEYVVEIIPINA